MSTFEWTDAEASDLEDLAINLGHVDDDPEVILSRTREIDETVRTLVAARERMAAAKALRDAAGYNHEDHWTDIALGGIDYVRSWLLARAERIERDDKW